MIWNNVHHLSPYIVKVLTTDNYDYEEGTLSATTLLSPPRQFALYKQHHAELECDVSETIASRQGTAIHALFEQVEIENSVKEKRMYHELMVDGEKIKISGKPDIILDMDKLVRRVIDIKSTSVWTHIYGSKVDDYVKQLSVYKYLGNKNGYRIGNQGEICMWFTDWSNAKAQSNPTYPQIRILEQPITLMNDADTEQFIIDRARMLLSAARDTKNLPLCTAKELWKDEDVWEVIKYGRLRPVTKVKTKVEADTFMLANNLIGKAFAKLKKSKAKRCKYCLARKHCDQYQQMKKDGDVDDFDIQTNLVTRE